MIRTSSAIISLLFLAGIRLCAAEAGFAQDFSEQIPGQPPAGWVNQWRKPVDDLVYVANTGEPGSPGGRQLLLDRTQDGDHTHFRLLRPVTLKNMGDAVAAKVSLRFRIESDSLVNAPFELELGTPDRKIVMLNFGLRAWGPHVYLYPTALDTWSRNWEAKRNLGSYRSGNWHRIELLVPYGEASPLKEARGVLYDENGKPGREFPVPVRNPMLEKTAIALVPGDKKQGARIYLTDFSIRPVAGSELRQFAAGAN